MSENEEKNDDLPIKKSTNDFPIQEYRLVPADYVEEGGSESEIDLLELLKTIWENRKTIYIFISVGMVLGVLVALLSPKEYRASSTLMPEYSTESSGGASGLLRQFGGALGLNSGSYNASSNAIRVELYPQIVNSLSFQYDLAKTDFYYQDYDTTAPLIEYFLRIKNPGIGVFVKNYTIGLPNKIIGLFNESEEPAILNSDYEEGEILKLSEEEFQFIGQLQGRISANLNDNSGIISVSATMPDPELSAEVAKYTIEKLTSYLTEYRTEKLLRDLEFINEQLRKAEERFNNAQIKLADFRDSNQGNLTARARTEEQRLQSEFNVAGNVYNSLTQQYEEAKINVQEETPMFKILQPVQVPVNDESSGAVILVGFLFLSGISSIGWIFLQDFLARLNFKS